MIFKVCSLNFFNRILVSNCMDKLSWRKTMQNTARMRKTADYQLFHASGDFFWSSLQYPIGTARELMRAYMEGCYELVYTFRLSQENLMDQLEEVFYKSQNIDRSWRKRGPCRSTSVGDIVRVADEYWIVASVGFKLGWRDSDLP